MIKDSGARRSFGTGAVRDIAEGKGRCDLLPLREVAELLDSRVLECVAAYVEDGFECHIYDTITAFNYAEVGDDGDHMSVRMLDLSKHFEAGCLKYGEPNPETDYLSNWQLGIPLHCYIDSGVRHYLKHIAGYTDERHDRAFIWNLLCALWTQRHRPELIDLPFAGKKAAGLEGATAVREVKRPAKVGEWIKIVYAAPADGDVYYAGDIGLVERIHPRYSRDVYALGGLWICPDEYVVLEGYEPEKGVA